MKASVKISFFMYFYLKVNKLSKDLFKYITYYTHVHNIHKHIKIYN